MDYQQALSQYGFVGHDAQCARLERMIEKRDGYAGSTLLFVGPPGSGKKRVAEWFSQQVSDPLDINAFTFDGTQKVYDFGEMFYSMGFGARKGGVKTYLFDLEKPLTPLISNALLKSLEEVHKDVTIILVVPDESYLLSTISSRSKRFEFAALNHAEADFVLQACLEFTPEQAAVMRQCYGTQMHLSASISYDEALEMRDWTYDKIGNMVSSISFIEAYDVAWFMSEQFEHYLAIILNWAEQYMSDPSYGPRFSELCANLLAINRHDQNLDLWIQRAFIKYLGWKLPPIVTAYETID